MRICLLLGAVLESSPLQLDTCTAPHLSLGQRLVSHPSQAGIPGALKQEALDYEAFDA